MHRRCFVCFSRRWEKAMSSTNDDDVASCLYIGPKGDFVIVQYNLSTTSAFDVFRLISDNTSIERDEIE